MTFANHMMVGAALAYTVKQPYLVFPLAVASHFVLDALPHFGYNRDGLGASLSHRLTYYVQVVNIAGIVILLMIVNLKSWLVDISMLLTIAPDLDWIYLYFYYIFKKKLPPPTKCLKFHRKIQWSERPWGIIIEIIFSALGILALWALRPTLVQLS